MSETMDPLGLKAQASTAAGSARIPEIETLVAGEFATWQLVFTVGANGLGTGGVVKIGTDSDTDRSLPQLHDPAAAEYLTVTGPSGAETAVQVQDLVTILVINTGRALEEGEEIAVTYGDRSGGGPGSRSQTFIEPRSYFWIEVDAEGAGDFIPIETLPELAVVGGEVVRLIVVAPSNGCRW